MQKRQIKVSALAMECLHVLEKYGYDKHTLWGNKYSEFFTIVRYYRDNNKEFYDPEFTKEFCKHIRNRYYNGEISRGHKAKMIRATVQMDECFYTGNILWRSENTASRFKLSEEFLSLRDSFLSSKSFHKKTRDDFLWAVNLYLQYLQDKGFDSFNGVSIDTIKNFVVESASSLKPGSLHNVLCYIKQFHMYLKSIGVNAPDCLLLLSVPVQREYKVYNIINDEELYALLNQIDTSSPIGKRDMAIFQLIITTGMRSTDVVNMKLTDIDWSRGEIHIIQKKTGNPLTLPLLQEAGRAIQDYILNGRPDSDAEEIFLRSKAPFRKLDRGPAVQFRFYHYLDKAGIAHSPSDGKTLHGLRRRLGTNMLTAGIPVTTIAQVLGHAGLESTDRYLSIDLKGLQDCALDFSGISVERSVLL